MTLNEAFPQSFSLANIIRGGIRDFQVFTDMHRRLNWAAV